jgi:hypothetical protein
MKKTRDKKSHDTVPLMLHIFRDNSRIFKYVLIKSAAIATGQNKLGDLRRKDQLLSSQDVTKRVTHTEQQLVSGHWSDFSPQNRFFEVFLSRPCQIS